MTREKKNPAMTMEKNVKPSDTLRKERRPFFLRLRRKSILFLKRAPQAGLR